MLEFKEKVFYNEYAMSLYQLAQTAMIFCLGDNIHSNQRWSLLGGFATFFLHKHFKEGLRINSFLLLLNESLLLLRQANVIKVPYWMLISSIGLYILSIKKLKVYTFPKPRGTYPVGYIHKVQQKALKNGQEDLDYSVYYPCKYDEKAKDQNWMAADQYWKTLHDTSMKDKERPGKVPKIFFRIQSQFLNKISMGVLADAPLISIDDLYYKSSFNHIDAARLKKSQQPQPQPDCMKQNNIENINHEEEEGSSKAKKMDKFPVIIISPGLATHRNAYTLFAKELASKGYIVFSMSHKEEIKNPHFDRDENWVFRYEQLQDRLETSKKMLDIIYNRTKMLEIFNLSEDENIEFDYNKVSMLGHSFGGSTALYTAMFDQRISGVVIGLDPCVYAFKKEEIEYCEFPKPLLCINSEDFYSRLYPYFQNDESLEVIFNHMKSYKNVSLNCAVKGAAHANQSDLALVMAGEFDLFGITTKGECAKKHMFLNLMLLEYYLERYLINDEKNLPIADFLKEYFVIVGEQHKAQYIFNRSEQTKSKE